MKIRFNFRERLAADRENLAEDGQFLPVGHRNFSVMLKENPFFIGLSDKNKNNSNVARPLLKGGCNEMR